MMDGGNSVALHVVQAFGRNLMLEVDANLEQSGRREGIEYFDNKVELWTVHWVYRVFVAFL